MRAGQMDLLDLEMPLTLRPNCRVSDDLLMNFSARNKGYKIERNKDGDLTIMTPVGGIGGTHERYVSAMLYAWTAQDGTGIDFGSNTGFNLPDGSCLSPDAAWLRLERWNALTLQQQEGYPPLCPDFIVEVRSKSDTRRMVEAKMQSWLDNGIQLGWLVDPIAKDIAIYRPGLLCERLDQPQTVTAGAPVAGFELVCAPLWPTH